MCKYVILTVAALNICLVIIVCKILLCLLKTYFHWTPHIPPKSINIAKLCGGTWGFFYYVFLTKHMQECMFMCMMQYGFKLALIISLSLSFSLSLESEWRCVYPTFTLKISSSDAADTGSFTPLSSSSSTFRSPEMALLISGPMSCNVRRPAYTQTQQCCLHIML